jgi:toxin-antitoxin system PIN domain toxin
VTRAALLDVNVLVAILDSAHIHHERAVLWFVKNAQQGWATCPLAELGFTRVMCSKGIPGGLMPHEAVALLGQLKASPGYRFVPDSMPAEEALSMPISGVQQVTDAYLISLCRRVGLRLATFDRRIDAPDVVEPI